MQMRTQRIAKRAAGRARARGPILQAVDDSLSASRREHHRLRHLHARSRWDRDELESRRAALQGLQAQEIVGLAFPPVLHREGPDRGLAGALFSRTAERDGRHESEGWRVRKDGNAVLGYAIVDTIRDADGQLLGFAKITRDISERRKARGAPLSPRPLRSADQLPNRMTMGIRSMMPPRPRPR